MSHERTAEESAVEAAFATATATTSPTGRPLRADARRKREAILAAAVEVFGERGIDIALDEVSKRAGVGIATLYRHFPTREALITGAYIQEVNALCDGVEDLLATSPPDEALVAWMRRFVGYVAGRPGMSLALNSIVASTDAQALQESHGRIYGAIGELMAAGQRAGLFRSDISTDDLAGGLSGISRSVGSPGSRERANRLIGLFVDGLRHGAPGPG